MKITIDFSDDEMKKIFEDAVYKRVLDELYRDNFAEGKTVEIRNKKHYQIKR